MLIFYTIRRVGYFSGSGSWGILTAGIEPEDSLRIADMATTL